MGLKQKIREYLLQKARNLSYKPADYCGFDKLNTVAILFEQGDQVKDILSFAIALEKEGKQVNLLGYIDVKRKDLQTEPDYPHFTKDETSWIGRPKSESVNSFLKSNYHVLVSMNNKEESPLQFVMAATKSDFNIGIQKETHTRIDLLVGSTDSSDYTACFKEMDYYLRFINK